MFLSRTNDLIRNIRVKNMTKLGGKCIAALEVPPENRGREALLPLVAFLHEMPEMQKLNLT